LDQKEKDVTNFNFKDNQFDSNYKPGHENYNDLRETLFHLALCHTIVVGQREVKG